jgi:hypothetical protein
LPRRRYIFSIHRRSGSSRTLTYCSTRHSSTNGSRTSCQTRFLTGIEYQAGSNSLGKSNRGKRIFN